MATIRSSSAKVANRVFSYGHTLPVVISFFLRFFSSLEPVQKYNFRFFFYSKHFGTLRDVGERLFGPSITDTDSLDQPCVQQVHNYDEANTRLKQEVKSSSQVLRSVV